MTPASNSERPINMESMRFPTADELKVSELFQTCLGALKGEQHCLYPNHPSIELSGQRRDAIYVDLRDFEQGVVVQIINLLNASGWKSEVKLMEAAVCSGPGGGDFRCFTKKLLVIEKPRTTSN
jgi:hypothetical protein